MRIAIAGGHSKAAPGASGHIDEYECGRAFVAQLIPTLQAAGYSVVNCSNEKGSANAELAEEVRLANDSGADLFIAVHFNSKGNYEEEPDGSSVGTECWHYQGSKTGKEIAARMSANVAAALGVRDRGAKPGTFYVLRKTMMTAVLLEVCFVDDADDANAWHETSWETLTKAVVDAIGDAQSAPAPAPAPAPEPAPAPAPAPAEVTSNFGGTYKCMASKLNVRDAPSLSGAVVASYSKGQTIVLDDRYTIADGYVWGQYTAYSGNRRYVAVGKATGKPEADDYLVKA